MSAMLCLPLPLRAYRAGGFPRRFRSYPGGQWTSLLVRRTVSAGTY
jgi:hypothetical protein